MIDRPRSRNERRLSENFGKVESVITAEVKNSGKGKEGRGK
jgi:hypothetical protein